MSLLSRVFVLVLTLTVCDVRGQGILRTQYPQSPAVVATPLPSEAYSEGACVVPQVATNTDPNWIVTQKTFYVPIASQFAHRRYAETILSRPPTSEEELRTMCLTIEAVQAGRGLNLTNLGYDDREFRQTCAVLSPGLINCSAVGSSAGVNPTKTKSTIDYIVSVDNRSYMLIVRCVDGFFRDYQLLTTRPTVSQEVYNIVLNATRNLGFDDRRLEILSYDNCLRSSLHLISPSNLVLSPISTAPLQLEGNRRRATSAYPNQNSNTSPFSNTAYAAPFANNLNTQSSPQSLNQPSLNNHQHFHPQQQVQQQIQVQPQQLQQQQQFLINPGNNGGPLGPFGPPHPGQYPPPFGDPSGFQPQFI